MILPRLSETLRSSDCGSGQKSSHHLPVPDPAGVGPASVSQRTTRASDMETASEISVTF